MAGDGISLQTNLAQLGTVAKTQAKSQQTPHTTTPFSEQVAKQDELKTQRVKQIEQTEKQQVDPDAERDRRRRRRLRRQAQKRKRAENDLATAADENRDDQPAVGGLIDTRV